jgi:hypothetical protein
MCAIHYTAEKVTEGKFVSAGLSTYWRGASGHPVAFNADNETGLVNGLLLLEKTGLCQTADQVRTTACSLTEANSLRHPLDFQQDIAGVN